MQVVSSALIVWLIVIAIMDFRLRKVRNWMVLLGLAIGLLALLMNTQPPTSWSNQIADKFGGLALAFAALLPFYTLRWMGAGDVKFAAVMGLWFGCSWNLLYLWLGASLLAGIHSLLLVLWPRLQASFFSTSFQVRRPYLMRFAAAPNASAQTPLSGASGGIKRSIPYAGYMAVIAIGLLVQGRL